MAKSSFPASEPNASSKAGSYTDVDKTDSKFHALLETSSAAIVVLTPDWELIDFNDAWCRFLGYERGELVGLSPRQLTHPDDQNISQQHIRRLVEGKAETYRIEKRYIRKDGTVIWGDLSSKALKNDSGLVEAIVSTIVDITSLKKREEELEASEAKLRASEIRFRDFTEASSDWFWDQDENFRFTDVVAFHEDSFVSQNKAFIGSTRWEFAGGNPDQEAHWQQHLDDHLARRSFRDFRYLVTDSDGINHVFSVSGKPVFDEQGLFKGYRGTGTDMTELVRVQTINERFLLAVNHLSEGLALWDADGKLVFCNEYIRKVAGATAPDLIPGITYEDWIRAYLKHDMVPEAVGRENAWVAERLAYFKDPVGSYEVQRAGRWYLFHLQKLPDGSTLHGAFDIHELKLKEEALQASEQRFKDFSFVSSDWFWESDENHRYTYFSDSFETVTGRHPDQFMGKTCQATKPKGVEDAIWIKLLEDMDAHRAFRNVIHSRTKLNGELIWVSTSGQPRFDAKNKFIGYRGTGADVTRIIEAAIENERSQQLLTHAIESISEGFVLYDKDDRLVLCNNKYKGILANSDEIIVPGASFEDVLRFRVEHDQYIDARGDAEAFIRERMDKHQNPAGFIEQRLSGGRWLRVEERKTEDGGTVGIRTDITQLKQTELQLRESEGRFRDFAGSASDWFWEQDQDLRFTDVVTFKENRFFDRAADSIGRTRWEFVDLGSDIQEHWQQHIEDNLARRSFRNFQYDVRDSHGENHVLSVSGNPIFDDDGVFKGYRGTATDVTDLKMAEAARRETESRFQSVVDNTPTAIHLKDTEGRFQVVNKTFEDWYGLSAGDVAGKTSQELFDPQFGDKFIDQDRQVLETGQVKERELLARFADGKVHPIYNVKFPVFGGAGKITGIGTIATDLTEFNLLGDQLRRAQRMEAIGQLTGGIAHDFNNLLGVMVGNAELLLDEVGQNQNAQHNVEAITKAVARGSSLTQRLLAFSRQQSLSPKPTVINDQILGLAEMLQRTLGETIALSTELGSWVHQAMVDPHQFDDALLNLAINARDAMPGGGRLTIETVDASLDEAYVKQHEDVTAGDYVLVTVSDTGTGIDAEALDKVFEPFFTTKDVGEGSGLGLSMVYGFVKQSKGHVVISSEPDQGTTVELYLPRSQINADQDTVISDKPASAPGSARILVVEDDDDVRIISTSILHNQGYEIVEAQNGKEAIELLDGGQSFDLLFTDMVLPGGINGAEIAEQAKRAHPDIQILYTTGYAENSITNNGEPGSEITIIRKPYRRAELLEKVEEILDSENR